MRLVSDNPSFDRKKRQAERRANDDLNDALRVMAANIIRVVRGAGEPSRVGPDLGACIEAFAAYRTAHGFYPSSEFITRALDPENRFSDDVSQCDDRATRSAGHNGDRWDWQMESLLRDARRAGLQMTASMLVEQHTQRRRAESDMHKALREFEELWNEKRKERQKAWALPDKKSRSPAAAIGRPLVVPDAIQPRGRTRMSSAKPKPPKPDVRMRAPQSSARDPFEPPSYAGLKSAALSEEIRAEFRVNDALGLVHKLNELWGAERRPPLPQGSYPSNPRTLNFVVNELRIAIQYASANQNSG